jgi:hypothetical protein
MQVDRRDAETTLLTPSIVAKMDIHLPERIKRLSGNNQAGGQGWSPFNFLGLFF